MIGTKTLAVLILALAVVGTVVALGGLTPERLMMRGFGTLFLVGSFGAVVGTLLFRLGRLGETSRNYLRWTTEVATWDVTEAHFLGGERRRLVLGENENGQAFDLSPGVRRVVCVGLVSTLALVAMDGRALEQLARASEGTSMASTYCPDETEAPPPVSAANEPGCELVRRAFALGYAKTLGECAPKQRIEAADAKPPCTRRQRGEPLLHYSWRLLDGFFRNLGSTAKLGYFKQAKTEFDHRAAHLAALRAQTSEMLTSAPHASHHIWTNLPPPDDGAFEEGTCTNRYLRLPHRPTPPPGLLQASKVFEHVVGQLLFEATYDTAAGHCREYHVHWKAPVDACQKLTANAGAFLAAEGALGSIRATLERYRVTKDLVALGGPAPALEPASFISFHCYIEGEGDERKSTPFAFAGQVFTAEELRVPRLVNAPLYIDRYAAVARLFVNGFHYGQLLSESALEQGAAAGFEAAFTGSDLLLTRLYELESIDIYLDPGWLAERPDLLEVYPYERHLKNFVQVFRRQYRRERGRL